MITKTYVLFLLMSFLSSLAIAASNQAFVYQGKILKPDGTPINSGNLTFTLSLFSPNAENCLLFKEAHTVNMDGKNGAFSITIGGGVRTDGYGGFPTLSRIFVNSGTISSLNCDVGTTYSPLTDDDRVIKVSFVDSGTTVVLDPMNIKAVPFALQAEQVGGYGAINLARISGAGSATAFTPNEFEFVKKLSLPATTATSNDPCANGEILKKSGGIWICAADATGGAPTDSNYGTKGVMGFDTDAATSGVVYTAAGIAKVNLGTGANQIAQLDAGGKLLVGVMPESVFKQGAAGQGGNTLGAEANIGTRDNFAFNFYTNDTKRMTILNDGNVGIGTATPNARLTIAGGTGKGLNLYTTLTDTAAIAVNGVNTNITLNPAATSNTEFRSNSFSADIAVGNSQDFTNNISGSYSEVRMHGSGNLAETTGAKSIGVILPAAAVSFNTISNANAIQALAVGEFAAVPLTGTISTARGLYVPDSSKTSPGLTINNLVGVNVAQQTLGTNNTLLLLGTTAAPAGNFGIHEASGYKNYFSGNVGIGATSPSAKLTVSGDFLLSNNAATAITCTVAGDIGKMRLEANILEFCDGTAWRTIATGSAAPSNYVVTSGAQTISGVKTFTNGVEIGGLGTGAMLSNTGSTLNISNGVNISGGPSTIAGDVSFDSNTLKVDSTNNRVGIGTGAPGELLHLKNPDTVGGWQTRIRFEQGPAAGHTSNIGFNASSNFEFTGTQNAGGGPVKFDYGGSNYSFMNGNVGIGTTSFSPLTNGLEIYRNGTTSNINLRRENNANYNYTGYTPSVISATNPHWGTGLYGSDSGYSIWSNDGSTNSRRMVINNLGKVGVGTTTPQGQFDISYGGPAALIIGADEAASTRTDSTEKKARVVSPHYLNAEESVSIFFANNINGANQLAIGGGTSNHNAATNLSFYTAVNSTTTTGTERMAINSTGQIGIGTAAATNKKVNSYFSMPDNGYGGYFFNEFNIAGSAPGILTGLHGQVNAQGGAVSVGTMRGISGLALNNIAGATTTNAQGGYFQAGAGAGTVTNNYGLFVDTPYSGGSITNSYGLFINSQLGTNKFGVYQSGANDLNYFAGKVGIGTNTPLAQLDLSGNAFLYTQSFSVGIPQGSYTEFFDLTLLTGSANLQVELLEHSYATTSELYNIPINFDDSGGAVGTVYRLLPVRTTGKRITGATGWGSGEFVLEMVKGAANWSLRIRQIGATDQVGSVGYKARIAAVGNSGVVKSVAGTDSSNYSYPIFRHTPMITTRNAVGILTANPTAALDVNGTVKATAFDGPMTSTSNSTAAAYTINTNSDGAGSDGGINFQVNGSNVAQFGNNGSFGFGSAVNGDTQMHLAGTYTPTGGGGTGSNQALYVGSTINVGNGVAGTVARVAGTLNENAAGTHSMLSGLRLTPPTIVANGATVTNASTLYIDGPTNATVTGGNYSLYVDSGQNYFGGNVGIGTSTPAMPLHVRSTAAAGSQIAAIFDSTTLWGGTDKIVSFRNNGVEKSFVDYNGNFISTGSIQSTSIQSYGTGSALSLTSQIADGAAAIGITTNNNVALTTAGAKLISFKNNNVEKAYIDKDGKGSFGGGAQFLAGSASDGTGTYPYQIKFGYSGGTDYPHFLRTRHNSGVLAGNAIDFYTNDGTTAGVFPANAVHGMTINGGNVGIGTIAPDGKLQIGEPVTAAASNMLLFGKTTAAAQNNMPRIHQFTSDGVLNELAIGAASTGGGIHFFTGNVTSQSSLLGTGSNTEKMTILNSGNVGIGTANPLPKLHIKESVNSPIANQLVLQNEGAGNHAAGLAFQVSDSSEYTTWGPKAGISFERTLTNGRGVLKFFNRGTNDAAAYTAADEAMRITDAKYIGIGTATPQGLLDVTGIPDGGSIFLRSSGRPFVDIKGDVNSYKTLRFSDGADGTYRWDFNAIPGNDVANPHGFGVWGGGAQRLAITTSGNIGIGTSSPWAPLAINKSVNGTYNDAISLDNNGAGGGTGSSISLKALGTDGVRLYTNIANATAGTEYTSFLVQNYRAGAWYDRFKIDGDGNVGIGTTSPSAPLEVVGTGILRTGYTDGGFTSRRANGTAAFPTAALNNDRVGYLIGSAYYTGGTSGYSNIAGISLYAAENQTDVARGSFMTFETSNIGVTSRTEKMRLTADGNLGIGSTNPYFAKLAVEGATTTYNSDSGLISAQISGTSKRVNIGYDTVADSGYIQSVHSGTGNKSLLLNANGGNVGVGATVPSHQLHVKGAGQAPGGFIGLTDAGNKGGTLYVQDSDGGSYNGGALVFGAQQGYFSAIKSYITDGGGNTVGSLGFQTRNATGDTALSTRMFIRNDGNVGIGTTAPGGKLNVQGPYGLPPTSGSSTTYNILRLTNDTGGATGGTLDFGQNGSDSSWIQSRNAGDYSINYPLFLNPNGGNVAIGTTAAARRLTVKAPSANSRPMGIEAAANGNLSFDFIHNGATGDGILDIGKNTESGVYDASVIRLNSAGDTWLTGGSVGIGTKIPGYKLDVQGGNVNSAGAYTNVSDSRLKEDIQPLRDNLDKVLQLIAVSYVWKDKSFDSTKQVGFIAQEVEKVFPEVVKTDDRGFKAMSYSQLVAPVVAAIKEFYSKWSDDSKELHSKVEAQARQIASIEEKNKEIELLKQKNDMLEKRLKRLEKSLNKVK